MADVLVINKVDSASPEVLATLEANLRELNPRATIVRAESELTLVGDPITGKRVVIVEDVTTTGGSAIKAAEALRAEGAEIVGVVGDVKYGGLDVTAPPEVYLPHTQHPVAEITIAVRTAGDPITLVPTARAALKSMDRELPISAVRLLADVVSRSIAERRFVMLLLACFAAVAVALAVIGVYGVLAYLVSQRTQEIGVRLAIGATPRDVVRLIVREGVALAGVGLLVGCLGALAAARVLSTMLFGIGAGDPLTFAAVVVVLTAAALCASYLPARRAARVDPMQALRAE